MKLEQSKDWYEIESKQKARQISDKSHLAVMSALPIELNELQIQAEFEYHATRQEDPKGKHSILIDAGAEWRDNTSDITRCFPTSGKFTAEHREIYETVLDMQNQALERMLYKPGGKWDPGWHTRFLLVHVLSMGIFKKEVFRGRNLLKEELLAFYPHRTRHMLGLDVHDVGGNPNL
nr:ASN_HP1_G0016410.mRNA.1.CDS.1 [Saccharomyces cerevisiae]